MREKKTQNANFRKFQSLWVYRQSNILEYVYKYLQLKSITRYGINFYTNIICDAVCDVNGDIKQIYTHMHTTMTIYDISIH